ncbi:unnamed protein product [Adineta steineri]|uniref:Uncharacterized protein n=2 Tax=Adineta steineri TaxID=433720 RepID=A0A815UQ19_9BILA|nr:unnamed protein product [Adineta steineri]CAF1649666.1 unnamed protein product [Adineta steineri]
MTKNENITRIFIEQPSYDAYDDNKDIIWPTVVGIFVALALGWMICRYKCSSKERSPHIVRCCPKTLCKNIRLCCMCIFRIKQKQKPTSDFGISTINKPRASSGSSLQETPFLGYNTSINRLSLARVSQQWPPPFILNQSPSFPLTIAVSSTIPPTSEPKRHPLRRESTLPENSNGRRESSLWPFRTINAVFHKQTSEIKENDLFFSA